MKASVNELLLLGISTSSDNQDIIMTNNAIIDKKVKEDNEVNSECQKEKVYFIKQHQEAEENFWKFN